MICFFLIIFKKQIKVYIYMVKLFSNVEAIGLGTSNEDEQYMLVSQPNLTKYKKYDTI